MRSSLQTLSGNSNGPFMVERTVNHMLCEFYIYNISACTLKAKLPFVHILFPLNLWYVLLETFPLGGYSLLHQLHSLSLLHRSSHQYGALPLRYGFLGTTIESHNVL